jgi:hypothetical protein
MAKYLDPKADVTFKKVFGEHKNLVISLLNALLPLDEGKQIEKIEYLPPELVPETPLGKNSIVDVRCEETGGRKFIVEMQMEWFPDFMQRVLLNSAKAYVRQLPKGDNYTLLQPVYSLSLVNHTFEPDLDGYYHYYHLVHDLHTEKVLDGLKNPAPKTATLFDEETAARLKAIKVDATAIKYWFEKALAAAGIEGWSVEISSEFTAIDVQDFSKAGYPRIAIPASRQIDGLKLVSLIMHEILGHARGSAEGWKLFGNLLKGTPIESLIPVMVKSHDETLYEGVAMRLEHTITGTEPLPWATISCSNCPNTNFAELGKIMYRYRLEGGVCFLDRYPQIEVEGKNDGPKISVLRRRLPDSRLVKRWSRKEEKHLGIVREIKPDLVFRLNISAETSMARKPEQQDIEVFRQKIEDLRKISFQGARIVDIDAEQPLEDEILQIKRIIWENL